MSIEFGIRELSDQFRDFVIRMMSQVPELEFRDSELILLWPGHRENDRWIVFLEDQSDHRVYCFKLDRDNALKLAWKLGIDLRRWVGAKFKQQNFEGRIELIPIE